MASSILRIGTVITVDDREGSAQLAPLLRAKGLPVTVSRMAYGDISFLGVGPEGEPVPIGIEVKSVRDVLQCITNGRFAGHQLPGLVQTYKQVYLLMEGQWRPDPKDGRLEVRHGHGHGGGQWIDATVGQRRFMYKDLLSWLCTISIKGGIKIERCCDWGEAILFISTLYRWWEGKKGEGWNEHESHLALNVAGDADFYRDHALLVRPSLLRRVAKELPGVGVDKSAAMAACFSSVQALVEADISTIALVPGIGRTMAQRIHTAIRAEDK